MKQQLAQAGRDSSREQRLAEQRAELTQARSEVSRLSAEVARLSAAGEGRALADARRYADEARALAEKLRGAEGARAAAEDRVSQLERRWPRLRNRCRFRSRRRGRPAQRGGGGHLPGAGAHPRVLRFHRALGPAHAARRVRQDPPPRQRLRHGSLRALALEGVPGYYRIRVATDVRLIYRRDGSRLEVLSLSRVARTSTATSARPARARRSKELPCNAADRRTRAVPEALGEKRPVVLDVRQPLEVQAEGIIAGSLHIPMNEVPAASPRSPAKASSSPSASAASAPGTAQWLRQQGYDASSLSGGLDAWRASGLPVAR